MIFFKKYIHTVNFNIKNNLLYAFLFIFFVFLFLFFIKKFFFIKKYERSSFMYFNMINSMKNYDFISAENIAKNILDCDKKGVYSSICLLFLTKISLDKFDFDKAIFYLKNLISKNDYFYNISLLRLSKILYEKNYFVDSLNYINKANFNHDILFFNELKGDIYNYFFKSKNSAKYFYLLIYNNESIRVKSSLIELKLMDLG